MMGIPAFPAISENGLEVWAKPLSDQSWAICFLNRGSEARNVNFNWKESFIDDALSSKQLDAKKTTYRIRDLWSKKELGTTDTPLSQVVPPHDVLMVRLTK